MISMDTVECENVHGERIVVPRASLTFRPTAYAIIVRDGAVLAARDRGMPRFAFPGGGVECGERLLDGLRREVREEVGMAVTVGELLHVRENFFYCDPIHGAWHAIVFYYGCAADPPDAQPSASDIEELRWVPINELREADFQSVHSDIIRIIRDRHTYS